jgi:hypothetical protein
MGLCSPKRRDKTQPIGKPLGDGQSRLRTSIQPIDPFLSGGKLIRHFEVITPVLDAAAVFNLCKLKTHSFTSGPSIIDLPVCVHCNSYKFKNTWMNELLGDVLRRIVKNNFQISKELEKIEINTECKEEKGILLLKSQNLRLSASKLL